nr:unnamed protein product [Spirometra erinaceieuropaei]
MSPYFAQEQAIVITAIETMGTQHSSPGSMVCADAGIEITKDDQLIRLRHRCQEGVKDWSSGSVDTDEGDTLVSLVRQAEAHQTIVNTLQRTDQSSHDGILEGKGDARVPALCPGATASEGGVAGIHLLRLALFGEPGVAEGSDLHLVACQFPNH